MLSPDVELVDLDGRHWANWWSLLWPPGLDEAFGIVVAFVEDGQLVRAMQLGKGEVTLDWRGISQKDLAAARASAGAGALLVLEHGFDQAEAVRAAIDGDGRVRLDEANVMLDGSDAP